MMQIVRQVLLSTCFALVYHLSGREHMGMLVPHILAV